MNTLAMQKTRMAASWRVASKAIAAGLVLQLSACATAFRGTSDEMIVNTDPEGAIVTTSLETPKSRRARRKKSDLEPVYYGCDATPCEFKMPRRALFLMTIEKDGYEPVTVGVEGKFAKRSLAVNMGGGVATATFMGAGAAATVSAFSSLGSAATATGGAAAGAATAGVFLIPVGIDLMTGSMLNHNPNPVSIVLPPKGTVFEPDPNVDIIAEKLKAREALRAKKKAFDRAARGQ